MSKQFALLKVTGNVSNYLSRERYMLTKMKLNDRVTDSFFESKVKQYNELVDLFNVLFRIQSDEQMDRLFEAYSIENDSACLFDYLFDTNVAENSNGFINSDDVVDINNVSQDDEWLDKQKQVVQSQAERSKIEAEAMLQSYHESQTVSIEEYAPADDQSVTFSSDVLMSRKKIVDSEKDLDVEMVDDVESTKDIRESVSFDVNEFRQKSEESMNESPIDEELSRFHSGDTEVKVNIDSNVLESDNDNTEGDSFDEYDDSDSDYDQNQITAIIEDGNTI